MEEIGEIIGVRIGCDEFAEGLLIDVGNEVVCYLVALGPILDALYGLASVPVLLQQLLLLLYHPQLLVDVLLLVLLLLLYAFLVGRLVLRHFEELLLFLDLQGCLELVLALRFRGPWW